MISNRLAIVLAVILGVISMAVTIVTTALPYGDDTTENAGYVVILPAPLHCAGWETRGNPGPFVNVDC